MRSVFRLLPAILLACTTAQAAEAAKGQGGTVDLSAEASRTAANDLARATAYTEATDASPKELAGRVNGAMARALEIVRAYPGIKAQTSSQRSWPQYDKSGRITAWHMRSDLQLETRDIAALSELLGKLQATMGVSQIAFMPSPETRHKAEDAAIVDGIAAFESRARLVATSMHSRYRIRQMSVGAGSTRPPFFPMARSAVSDSAMPLEAGDSQITITVSGQIELME